MEGTGADTVRRSRIVAAVLPFDLPIDNDRVDAFHDHLFAPWVKDLGLTDLEVGPGWAQARLPQQTHLWFTAGPICGQALMAAIDTVAVLAMSTRDRLPKGTASQNTQFIRPADGDDVLVRTEVLRFGSVIGYGETKVTFVGSGKLVAHSTCEFVF